MNYFSLKSFNSLKKQRQRVDDQVMDGLCPPGKVIFFCITTEMQKKRTSEWLN